MLKYLYTYAKGGIFMEFSISKYYGGKAGAFSLSFDDGCYKESTL